jgi:hypothetical protein
MKSQLLGAAVLAIALPWGPALADQPQRDPQSTAVEKPDPTLTPRDMNEREQEYFAALRKCEGLAENERQECVKAVKAEYGVM